MAQADYSIANQNFPATRADINSHLEAIATNNSGTSAPSTQYAGQFWIDTTSSTWTLYIHDGADDIQFATIDTSANTVNFIDSELGDNSVTTAKIADGNVTSAKLSYPLTTFSSTGIDDNATSTAITIDSSENVGIKTTSPKGDGLSIGTTDATAFISPGGSNNSLTLTTTGANGVMRFYTQSGSDNNRATTESMRIDSSGNVGIGTNTPSQKLDVVGSIEVSDGIYIGGTGTANKLDDYEEGTWTPAYLPSGTAFDSISYGQRVGRYVKIGKIVYVEGRMSTSSITKGSASGGISIEGLPFIAEGSESSFNFAYARNFLGEQPISGLTRGSGTDEILMYYRTTAPSLTQGIQVSDMDTGSGDNQVYFSGTYTTTA